MSWPVETISIDTESSPPGPVPDGLKVATFTGPDSSTRASTPVIPGAIPMTEATQPPLVVRVTRRRMTPAGQAPQSRTALGWA